MTAHYAEPAAFDRYDICEAYAVMEWEWNLGGWLHERKTNRRRLQATSIQLSRIGFKPGTWLCWETLSENGQTIYRNLCRRYGFEVPEDRRAA